jgi:hypothetical protein
VRPFSAVTNARALSGENAAARGRAPTLNRRTTFWLATSSADTSPSSSDVT